MIPVLARALLFACGFALWAFFALQPWEDGAPIREGWDVASYWSIGVPVLAVAQIVLAALSQESPARQPLWVLAGHLTAMLLLHPPGTDLGLLPLSLVFIYLPGYVALLLAALIGRGLARLVREIIVWRRGGGR